MAGDSGGSLWRAECGGYPGSVHPIRIPYTAALADIAARLAQRGQQDVHHKRKLRGQREGTVLDPCRLALDFTLDSGADGAGSSTEGSAAAADGSASTSRTDLRLEASDLRLTLSPDVLDLGAALASSALAPLMQASWDSREGRG